MPAAVTNGQSSAHISCTYSTWQYQNDHAEGRDDGLDLHSHFHCPRLSVPLAMQVDGLSGHLPRFWSDVINSTWLYPEHHWRETYSDRGGNLPYWLNGVIPLVAQLPHVRLFCRGRVGCDLHADCADTTCASDLVGVSGALCCEQACIFVVYHDSQQTSACIRKKNSLYLHACTGTAHNMTCSNSI